MHAYMHVTELQTHINEDTTYIYTPHTQTYLWQSYNNALHYVHEDTYIHMYIRHTHIHTSDKATATQINHFPLCTWGHIYIHQHIHIPVTKLQPLKSTTSTRYTYIHTYIPVTKLQPLKSTTSTNSRYHRLSNCPRMPSVILCMYVCICMYMYVCMYVCMKPHT